MNPGRLAIGSVVLLVAGCVAAGGTPSTVPAMHEATVSPTATPTIPAGSDVAGIVPWSSETPAPPAMPTVTPTPDAPTCQADQLVAGVAGWGGATGSLLGGFLLWNTSDSACRLQGFPSVAIVDAAGRSVDVTDVVAPSPISQPIVLRPRQAAPAVGSEPPRGLASVTIQWFNWCGSPPEGPLGLAVTLPEGGVLHLTVVSGGSGGASTPRCDVAGAPSTVTVSAFEETTGPLPTEPPVVPAEGLRLALDVPDQVTAGEALLYVAALTNPSASAIPLTPCPAYRESLLTPDGQLAVDYVLDCAAVPSIGPGETVRFAMVLEIPRSQPPTDQAALIWELDPYYSEGFLARQPAQKVVVRIVAP